MDKILSKIISDISTKHSIPTSEVEKILSMPYKMMREKITALEFRGKMYDEVKHLKTNFNMPVLFKLYLNEFKINNINKNYVGKEED